jgi:hypothetical protein
MKVKSIGTVQSGRLPVHVNVMNTAPESRNPADNVRSLPPLSDPGPCQGVLAME